MNLQEAKSAVDSSLSQGRLAIVVGRCRVQYEGRAASKLSEGDRVLIIKNDGTFLVHQPTGMAAINYQGPGASILSSLEPDALVVSAVRSKKDVKEHIHVRFFEVQWAGSFSLKDDKSLALFGSERQLSGLLMSDLSIIEDGMVP
ncbi:MAG: endonuclease NucS, partial [Candidatus Micrarchaeota archaeon]